MYSKSTNIALEKFEVKRMSSLQFIHLIATFIIGVGIIALVRESFWAMIAVTIVNIIVIIYFFKKKGYKEKTFIEIYHDGIWVHNRHITNWTNYIGCSIKNETMTYDYTKAQYYKKVIYIQFKKENESGYFINKLYFNNEEDKTENEVVEAIEKFYSFYCNKFKPVHTININKRLK